MAKITLEDLKKPNKPGGKMTASSRKLSLPCSPVIGNTLKTLKQTIGKLEPDQVIPYTTAGIWSMHQLMDYCLQQLGPSRVFMTTWTITEDPLRSIVKNLKNGNITELHAIFDYRIEKRKPEAFQFASQVLTRIKLTKIHAKTLVIRSEKMDVSVMSSANFTNNPRIECGTIFTNSEVADFNEQWISDVIDGKEVFRGK